MRQAACNSYSQVFGIASSTVRILLDADRLRIQPANAAEHELSGYIFYNN